MEGEGLGGGVGSGSARHSEPADSLSHAFLVSFFGAFLERFSAPFWRSFSEPKGHPKCIQKSIKF